jgi:hypothetical protein
MKTKPFFFFLSLAILSGSAFSASRNYCDDLIDSGSSPEQVQKCQEKFGVSDYAKSKAKKSADEKEKADMKDVEAVKRKSNLETKTFSTADLNEESFGKPFFAIRGEWKFGKYSEKRLTEGDSLCSYLGFEKAVTTTVSAEINLAEASGKGVIVDKSWYGKVKDPEVFKEDSANPDVWVRKITEITCVKRKNKELEGSDAQMKMISEVLVVLNDPMQDSHSDSDSKIDNKKRDSKKDKGTFSPAVPDWMKDGSVGK